jgi:hypothetical protein
VVVVVPPEKNGRLQSTDEEHVKDSVHGAIVEKRR